MVDMIYKLNLVVEWIALLLYVLYAQVQMWAQTAAILTKIFNCFCQSLQADAVTVRYITLWPYPAMEPG
jgi:hypothetical protein